MATTKKTAAEATPAPIPVETAPAPQAPVDTAALMAAFIEYMKQNAAAVDRQTEALKPKPTDAITPEYLAAQNREFNRPRFKRTVFQNAYEANPHGLSDAILDKVDQLTPGTYMGGVVKVIVDNDQIILSYKNKTLAERFELTNHFSSFSDLVNKLYDEMKARETADKK